MPSSSFPRGPRGEYRGHAVKVALTDREYDVLAAESDRRRKSMAALMREAFFASVREGDNDHDR